MYEQHRFADLGLEQACTPAFDCQLLVPDNFCEFTYLLVKSRIARFDSCAMTRPLPSFCKSETNSLMPFSRPPLRVGDFSLSTTSSKDTECLRSACKKSFLQNSLTKMMSGAYGDLPLYEKRAFTRALAVSSKFAVLSTTAAVMELALETSWLSAGGPLTDPSWTTCRQSFKKDASCTGCCATSNVSLSSADLSVSRRMVGRLRRLFSI